MTGKTAEWIRFRVRAPEHLSDIVAGFLVDRLGRGVEIEDDVSGDGSPHLVVTAYLSGEEAGQHVSVQRLEDEICALFSDEDASCLFFSTDVLADTDWHERWKEYFRPVRVGRHMVIKPSWQEFVGNDDDLVINIDPGQAFGVGTHASTALMLESMEDLFASHDFYSVLDVGTGTGILAIAAVMLGAGKTTAIDIDVEAERAAKRNAELNGVADRIDISATPVSDIAVMFDLVLANIERDTLISLAEYMGRIVRPGGWLLVSGVLVSQADDVAASMNRCGFVTAGRKRHREDIEWVALLFRKVVAEY